MAYRHTRYPQYRLDLQSSIAAVEKGEPYFVRKEQESSVRIIDLPLTSWNNLNKYKQN